MLPPGHICSFNIWTMKLTNRNQTVHTKASHFRYTSILPVQKRSSFVTAMDGKNAKISHSQPFKDSTALLQRLQEVNVSPLWAQMARLNPAFPNPTMEPFLWQYRQIRPCLLGAGQLISEKQAERRVLMLVNPRRSECKSSLYSQCPSGR